MLVFAQSRAGWGLLAFNSVSCHSMDLEHLCSVDRDGLRSRLIARLKNEANQKASADLTITDYVGYA